MICNKAQIDNPRSIPTKFALIWFSGFRGEDLNVIFYQNMSKSVERKISQKNPEYMLTYSLSCSCSYNLSSFWFIIKQQWTIEEISIFINSSHLEWRAGLSVTILKGTHPARDARLIQKTTPYTTPQHKVSNLIWGKYVGHVFSPWYFY